MFFPSLVLPPSAGVSCLELFDCSALLKSLKWRQRFCCSISMIFSCYERYRFALLVLFTPALVATGGFKAGPFN